MNVHNENLCQVIICFPFESALSDRQKILQYPKAPHTYLTFHPSLVLAVHCIDTALDCYGQTCFHVFTMHLKAFFRYCMFLVFAYIITIIGKTLPGQSE